MPRPDTWPGPRADVHPADLELIDDLIAEWDDASPKHRANTTGTVRAFAAWLAARGTRLAEAAAADCREWLAARKRVVRPNTQVANWTQLKGFYRLCEADTVSDPLAGRVSPMARIGKPDAPAYVRTKAARADEYEALLGAFDRRTGLGLRNAAICSLMFRSAMRVGELAQLDLADLDLDERRLLIEETKNDEPRRVPLHPETVTMLRRWLRRRGDRPGPLFVGERGGRRITTAGIQSMFDRAVSRAGVALTPHTLRRGWLAEYVSHGGDVVTAMHIAGWKREVMPHRYLADRRDETAQAVFDDVAARQVRAKRHRLRVVG